MMFEPWFKNPHWQTILADLLGKKIKHTEGEIIQHQTIDGDILVSEYFPVNQSRGLVLLCHGLSGDGRSQYNLRVSALLQRNNYSVVLFNHRNCGIGKGLAKKFYNSGRGEDIGVAIRDYKLLTKQKVAVVGFSMSGNAALRLVTSADTWFKENANDFLPDLCLAINPPINLKKSSLLMNQSFSKIYQLNFMLSFRKLFKEINKFSPEFLKYSKIKPWIKIYDFDNLFTAPMAGYLTADDYYEQCSTYLKLNDTQVKTVILTSEDDPFVYSKDFKFNIKNSLLKINITEFGGHMGYLDKVSKASDQMRWMDQYIVHQVINELT